MSSFFIPIRTLVVSFILLLVSSVSYGFFTPQSTRILSKTNGIIIGKASWYGTYFHGRRTANGEIYNMYDVTAAHKKLPFGTWIRVTNLKNGRKLFVRINDRGPYVAGRDIDLSYGAARELGMVESGVSKVKLEIFNPNSLVSKDLNTQFNIQTKKYFHEPMKVAMKPAKTPR